MKWTTATYALLFSGLGFFSYFLIVNNTDFPKKAAQMLYTWKAFVFILISFNMVGYSTLWMSGWMNRKYAISTLFKWKIGLLCVMVIFLFLLLNYGLFVSAKILANAEPILKFSSSGCHLLLVVWLVELVVMGLLLSNRTMQANWLLRQEATKLQVENAQVKYIALQNQLNPHFLFNSLNTLLAEIKHNPSCQQFNLSSFTIIH